MAATTYIVAPQDAEAVKVLEAKKIGVAAKTT